MDVPDLLLPEALSPRVSGTIFAAHIRHYASIGSTNVAAMRAAAEGAPEGAVFLAEEQTAGRGRGDHAWDSAPSVGIYCSVVLRPLMSPLDALFLSLMTGVAVAEAVELTTGLRPDLRWPNDVLLKGRKFCGVLTEMNAEPMRVRYVVVGIGINVNHAAFPAELASIATSLRIETGREWSRVELAAALLKSLDNQYRELAEGRPGAQAAIIRSFEDRSSFARARRVEVDEGTGKYTGITEGLDRRGFLLVRSGDGLRTVLSGSVRALDGK
jgi:BirA family biotin operon repressor/biotin-[acetyl-CoA-carboxylase] ligase